MDLLEPTLRNLIVETLRLLSSEQEQLKYETDVPHVDVTAELLCMWFDEAFIEDSARLRACFSANEWWALTNFDTFFDQRTNKLPEGSGTVRSLLNDATWRDIMNAAARMLQTISTQPSLPVNSSTSASLQQELNH